MLSQLQKLISFKMTRRRREKGPIAVRIRHFERLESRSLLSASPGMAQFEADDYGRSANSLVESPHWSEGFYAPPPQLTAFGSSAMSHLYGPQHNDSYGYESPTTYKNVGDGPGAWSGGAPIVSSQSMLSADRVSSASKPVSAFSAPTQIIYIFVVSNSPASFGNFTAGPSSTSQQQSQPNRSLPLAATASSTKASLDHSANYQKDFFGAVATDKGINAAAAAIPSAAQLLSRNSDRAAVLPSGAVDLAIRSYSPGLLLTAANGSYDRTAATSAIDNTAQGVKSLGDYIEVGRSSVELADDGSTDSFLAETDTIDALLSRLQDVDSLSWEASQTPGDGFMRGLDASAVDMPMPLAVANIALANAEGGMAMIEVGDVRANEIDLSDIADDVATQSHVHVAGEAAVGFYQAMDIGGEEVPAEVRLVASPKTQPVKETRTEGRYSTEERSGKRGKAAAAAGATALVGAMVWCAQRKQSDDETTTIVRGRRIS